MSKRMTVVFDDEELYRALKIEAARSGRPAKDIVADAVREWLEILEDRELSADLDEIRAEANGEGDVEVGEYFRQREEQDKKTRVEA